MSDAGDWVGRSVADVEARHKGPIVDLARDTTGNVVLSRLVVPADRRGRGIGAEVTGELIHQADDHEATLALTPSADLGADPQRLERWYRRLGFRPNRA